MAYDDKWREKELSYEEVVAKYPDVPPLVILKIDLHRRGLSYTQAAIDKIDPKIHQINPGKGFYGSNEYIPESLIFNDGSFVNAIYNFDKEAQRDPYIVDVVDDRIVIVDQGKVLTEVFYWEKPDYYDKLASNGEPLSRYVHARPQRLDINLSDYCFFWDTPGHGCKYCTISPNFKKSGAVNPFVNPKYVEEALTEALKQPGRYSSIMFGSGSVLSGKELLDDEVDGYIELLNVAGQFFNTKKFPSTMVATAHNDRQLERLYEETGLMTYTTDVEVLNKELFEWICPGKAERIGYEEWRRRLFHAVDVFGKGNVTSGCVIGVEFAQPNGFTDENVAYDSIIENAEEIISHGISLAANVWRSSPNSILQYQKTPSLDYFIRVLRQFDILHHKYEVGRFTDDYRRCGTHPGLDLLRI